MPRQADAAADAPLTRRPLLLRPSYLLSVPSTSTSVGLNLASLPSTPSPIGLSASFERSYFPMIGTLHNTSSKADHPQVNIPHRRRRGSDSVSTTSSSSPPGAAGILAALSSTADSHSPQKARRAPPPYLAHLARNAPAAPAPTRAAMPPTPPHSESHSHPADQFDSPASRGSVSTFAGTPTSTISSYSVNAPAAAAPPALSHVSVSAEAQALLPDAPRSSSLRSSSSRSRGAIPASMSLPRLAHPSAPTASVQRSSAGFMPKRAAAPTASSSQGGGNVYMPRSQSASDRLSGMLQLDARAAPASPTSTTDRQVRTRTTSGTSTQSIPPPPPRAPPSVLVPTGTGPTFSISVASGPASPAESALSRQDAPGASDRSSSSGGRPAANLSAENDAQAQATEDKREKKSSSPPSPIFTTHSPPNNTHLMPYSDPVARSTSASPGSERSARYTSAASVASSGGAYRTPQGSPAPSAASASASRPTPYRVRSGRKGSDREDKAWLPTGVSDTDGEIELNDVDAPSTTDTTLVSSAADDGAYTPPYEPRKRHSSSIDHKPNGLTTTKPTHQRYALTLAASLSSGSDLLALSSRRVELELLWDTAPAPSMWDYVPCARYVPAWTIRAAGAKSGVEEEGGLVWWIVARVPVVGGVLRAWF